MSASMCINHPIRAATGRCKRCGKPLCNDCKITYDNGVFCSEACSLAVKAFTDKAAKGTPVVLTQAELAAGQTYLLANWSKAVQ